MSVLGVPPGVDRDELHPKVLALFHRPQWEQRTPAWYAVRRDLLTASDAAAALGIPPFASFKGDPRAECMKKKLDNLPIRGMMMVHGVKYESEACEAVSRHLGEPVHDFGLLRHPEHPWLAASPDGVTGSGLCIEIKAPVRRSIVPGKCPEHYIPQVQVQLECLDLDECVFAEYRPGFLTPDGEPFLSVVRIERDRRWFADALPKLRAFYDEYAAARETHVAPGPPPELCTIVAGLYPVDDAYPTYVTDVPDVPDVPDDEAENPAKKQKCAINDAMYA